MVWMRASTMEAPGDRKRTGNPAEQACMVGAVDRDLGDRARRQRLRVDSQRRLPRLGVAHKAGVTGMRLGIER
jgi:hypothetical protein